MTTLPRQHMVDTMPEQKWPIKCECGAVYAALEDFRKLPLDNSMSFDEGDRLEIRCCPCDRLLGIWLDRDGNPQQQENATDDESKTQS